VRDYARFQFCNRVASRTNGLISRITGGSLAKLTGEEMGSAQKE